MDTEVAIILTAGGIIGAIITTQLWQLNWFKRENFKIQKSNVMAENKIKLRKLEKELGMVPSKNVMPKEPAGMGENISHLLNLIRNIDPEQLPALIDVFMGGGEENSDISKLGTLIDAISPDAIAGLIEGFTNKQQSLAGEQEFIR